MVANVTVAKPQKAEVIMEPHSFGWAIKQLKAGEAVRRRGWNGKGIWISLQLVDEHSFMSAPYIYMDTTNLETDNPEAPKVRVPWLASQTDMLAEDWEIQYLQADAA